MNLTIDNKLESKSVINNEVDSFIKELGKSLEKNQDFQSTIESEVLREIKTSYTLHHINKLLKTFNINEIYFADDSQFNHDMFEVLLGDYKIKLNSIVPKRGENYLSFINNELESKYLNGLQR